MNSFIAFLAKTFLKTESQKSFPRKKSNAKYLNQQVPNGKRADDENDIVEGKEKEKVGRMNPDHRGSTQAGDERHFHSIQDFFLENAWKTT